MNEEETTRSILEKYKTIAVVGLSRDPSKDSYRVAEYLKSRGYSIIPVNPFVDEILGQKCYKSLLDIPEEIQKTIEIVDIFRPSKDIPPIVDQAIQLKRKHGNLQVVWMQLGIVNKEAADRAMQAGLTIIMDKCMMIEHKRLSPKINQELEQIQAKKMQELQKRIDKPIGQVLNMPIALGDAHFNKAVQQYPLIVIDFWATWCGPCRMVAPVIDELARDYAGKVVFGKLNIDENPDTAMQFGVMSIPTLLVMKNGVEVDRIIGAAPRQMIEAKLQKYMP